MYKTWNKMEGNRYQYVCPPNYSFFDYKGNRLGRVIWRKDSELDGIYVDKDIL